MKITDIKPYPVRLARDTLIVKVETDEGVYGLGEAGCSSRELAEAEAVRHFRSFLIGCDPLRIEHLWQLCYRSNYHEGGRILTGALSAIDIALWDIKGKALGVPVYELLGGACRERVYGFATTRALSDDGCIAEAKRLIAEGWPALRLTPASAMPAWAGDAYEKDRDAEDMFEPRASAAITAKLFGRAADELPVEIPLGIDMHHRLSVAEAASFCGMLPPGRMAFLEEPIRDEHPGAYRALRRMTPVPFAIGEEWSSKWAALPYIENDLVNFCRIDVCNIGGLGEARKVANWCEAHYVDIMPHNPLGPVCTAATVHLCFAVNNFAWVEFREQVNESAKDLFPVMIDRNGPFFPLPGRPGLGIEIDESALAAHRYGGAEVPHWHEPDGSVTNW